MTKVEAINSLRASGEITIFRRTPTWEKAFELYNSLHGTRLQPNCGTCFKTVKEWLES